MPKAKVAKGPPPRAREPAPQAAPKKARPAVAPPPSNVLELDLPEIDGRTPYTRPTSHLVKVDQDTWREAPSRRASGTLLPNAIRTEVDKWRDAGHPGASDTSRRLLQYWFEEDHLTDHRVPDAGRFQYFFCQREAAETIIYLFEVKGFRDVRKLIETYYRDDVPRKGQKALGPTFRFSETTAGKRKMHRYEPKVAKEVDLDLPRQDLARMAVKMATGSGKTVVMALLAAWSYLNRRLEKNLDLADNFLVIAPNVIVFERLRSDFESGRIFHTLPIIPPEWKADWHLDVILRGEAKSPGQSGTLFLTNIQQIYDKEEVDAPPINPIAGLLGPKVKANLGLTDSMLERIKRVGNLMVLNDEAHHVHDEGLKWNETLSGIDDDLRKRTGTGLVAWLDFSATPKNQHGTYFPWIVVDYPLAQAVEDRIVKAPLIIHQTDKPDPAKSTHEDAGDVYNEWISIAVARWRQHTKDYGEVGEKPLLFVMAETTKDADSVAERLEQEDDLKGRVLLIHIKERGDGAGEITEKDLNVAREAAREIDSGRSRYRAVVSVLMLREGWDVRNVSVILGLRPFTSKANILPEQAVGRGLRLMRKIPMGQSQVLELIGTNAFEDFVRELEKEGVGVPTRKTPPKPGVTIYADEEKRQYDIEIPRTTASFVREYKRLDHLDPKTIAQVGKESDLTPELRQLITLRHGTVDVNVGDINLVFADGDIPAADGLLSALTNRVMRSAKVTGCFPLLYPKVREYVREYCFGKRVQLEDPIVRRALNNGALLETIARVIGRAIGELTAERREVKVSGAPYRLSEMEEFIWRRRAVESDRTIFSYVACYNDFEISFARFLERADDVVRYAKLAEHFTQFHVQYLKSTGAVGVYYPDFVVVQKTKDGPANWIVETKGWEDTEVPAKDAQMARWCQEVTKETGQPWRYLKVPQKPYERRGYATLRELARAMEAVEPVPPTRRG